jgi:hypothetical protein
VTRRILATTFPPATMTSPDGGVHTITLNQASLGLDVIDVDKPGLYRFDDGTLRHATPCGGGGRQSRPAGILRRAHDQPETEAAGRCLGRLPDVAAGPTPSSAWCGPAGLP